MKRRILGATLLVASVACGIAWRASQRRAASGVVAALTERIPQAKQALKFQGTGFTAPRGAKTFVAAPPKGARGVALSTHAPLQASGAFEVGRTRPWRPARFTLPNAAPVAGHVEGGVVAYANAYPGVDVLTTSDGDHVELGYAVHDAGALPELRLHFADDAGTLVLERERAVLRAPDGQTRLAVTKPLAFDAHQKARLGGYHIDGHDLVLELDLNGMTAPVYVDPVIFIPEWSIVDDARQPGGEVYDASLISRETQIVYDAARQVPVLVRPSREHRWWQSGFDPGISATPRVASSQGPQPNEAALDEWRRIAESQSEVWERRDGRWQLQPDTTLPGLIDAAVAFDPTRNRVVAYGGGVNALNCATPQGLCFLDSSWSWDATYERVGTEWISSRIPGSPSPRMRATMTAFGSKLILFGGRALRFDIPVAGPNGVPAGGGIESVLPSSGPLLNDTWSYDGTSWSKLTTGNTPPPQDSAQLVQDPGRRRLVLIGGSRGADSDAAFGGIASDLFSIWEFDGTDWIQRFAPNDPALPPELQNRRGMAAMWHPGRQTVLLFGGFADKMGACPLTPAQVMQSYPDVSNWDYLTTHQCFPGYAQDFWEWDGTSLHQLTRAAFASYGGPQNKLGIYRQIADTVPSPLPGGAQGAAGVSALWPFRYDPRPDHFALKSTLERSYVAPGSAAMGAATDSGTVAVLPGAAPPNPTFVSPPFYTSVRPQMFYDAATGKITIITAPDGRAYATDLTTWDVVTPPATPFDTGVNDISATAWDSYANRLLLFDPRDGSSWERRAAGWQRLPLATNLAPNTSVPRTLEDSEPENEPRYDWPMMAFDRRRHAAMLLYSDTLFELTDSAWQPHALPAALTHCTAARPIAYDGARHRTVVLGCQVPAQTWEWDGHDWFGPFPSPFTATALRDFSMYPAPFGLQSYTGTVQSNFAHQAALAELPSLGGVGIVDWDGTLRIWNGVAWSAGPKVSEGSYTDEANRTLVRLQGVAPSPTGYLTNYELPVALNPPLVEDSALHSVFVFRDGPMGMEQLDLNLDSAARAWTRPLIGRPALVAPVPVVPYAGGDFDSSGNILPPGKWYADPAPLELWSPELFPETTYADPATAVTNGQPYTQGLTKLVDELAWPFRLFTDTEKKRTLLLSHRGTLWQLGGETAVGIGDACATVADCGEGVACVHGKCSAGSYGDACDNDQQCMSAVSGTGACIDGVCCDNRSCELACNTCNGAHPGHCEAYPAGTPDLRGRRDKAGALCDAVGCDRVCPGNTVISDDWFSQLSLQGHDGRVACVSPPDPRPCGPGPTCVAGQFTAQTFCVGDACPQAAAATTCPGNLPCADATACLSACRTRTDCANPTWSCNASGTCAPDRAAQIAAQLGIPQLAWQGPRRRTSQEIRDIFRDAGVPEDDAGVFLLPIPPSNGLSVGYDPDLKTPNMGLRACLQHINACVTADNPLDQCVEAMPRCVSATPWLGDSAGEDCCPEQCLANYLEKRRTSTERQAFGQFFSSGCYPGLGGIEPDGGAP